MDQVDPHVDIKRIRIKLIRKIYESPLTHNHHKCKESAGVILTFKKKCWVYLATPFEFF